MGQNMSGQNLNRFGRIRNQFYSCFRRTNDHSPDLPEVVQQFSPNNQHEQSSPLAHRSRSPTRVEKRHFPVNSLQANEKAGPRRVESDTVEYHGPKSSNRKSSWEKRTPISTMASSLSQEKRVVLIGITGHGKGTFANFLYNLRQASSSSLSPFFGESEKPYPHTQNPYCQRLEIQNSPNASDIRKTMRFNILDTPGLNDIGREKDLNHMLRVFEKIGNEFYSVHTLVLVYSITCRIDGTIEPALRYYRDLFAPLFRAHNVILVLTHVSSDDYEIAMEDGTWNSTVQSYVDGCNKALQLETDAWNCPINRCFFVNSKWASRKIETLLKNITTNQEFKEDDLLYRSYLMRERILDHIAESSEIVLDTHLIPLPVTLENERMNALRVIDGRIQELLKTVDIENKFNAMQLREIERLHTEINSMKNKIEWYELEINRLSDTQKTPEKYIFGDDIIRIYSAGKYYIDAPCNSSSPCGGCTCKLKTQQHNASRSGELLTRGTTHCVKVQPDLLNFRRKEDHYWFYRFWLEYSGTKHNESQIRRHQMEHREHQAKQKRYQQQLKKTMEDLNTSSKELAAHRSNLENLTHDKDILLPKRFKIENIQGVLTCMKRVMGSPDEIANRRPINSDSVPMSKEQCDEYRH